jgi:hypothetical protein
MQSAGHLTHPGETGKFCNGIFVKKTEGKIFKNSGVEKKIILKWLLKK